MYARKTNSTGFQFYTAGQAMFGTIISKLKFCFDVKHRVTENKAQNNERKYWKKCACVEALSFGFVA